MELTGPQERFHRSGNFCSQGREEVETWLELLGSKSLWERSTDSGGDVIQTWINPAVLSSNCRICSCEESGTKERGTRLTPVYQR